MLRSILHAPARSGRRRLAAALVVPALLVTGCGGDDASTSAVNPSAGDAEVDLSDVTLKVGELGTTPTLQALLTAAGEWDSVPYEVEWSTFATGGPALIEAARGGSVDIGQMADTPPIFAQQADSPVKIIAVSEAPAGSDGVVGLYAKQDSGIADVADLQGKKIGITNGTILQYTVLKALEEAGLSYTDVEAVNLAPTDAVTAYQAGDVDAVAALQLQRAQLELAGDSVELADGAGLVAGYNIQVATNDALADPAKEAAIEDWIVRVARAEKWAAENPDEWVAEYVKATGVPEPAATLFQERNVRSYVPIDGAVIANQQEQADAFVELGLLPAQLDAAEQFDDRFNDAIAAVS